ncbi:uncharacterized [Tachysurus ichikawai]
MIIIVYCCLYRVTSQEPSPNDDPYEPIADGGHADCKEKKTDAGSVYQALNQRGSVYESLQMRHQTTSDPESVYECIDDIRTRIETQIKTTGTLDT